MTAFRFFTAGESHGKGLTAIIEGVPAGLPLTEEYIAKDLARRQRGYGRGGRMQIEQDRAEIISGVRHGLTLGSPISLFIQNRDFATGKGPDGVPWIEEMSVSPTEVPFQAVTRLRPGHADMAGAVKYNQQDARNILERSSARETAARVAVGAVVRRFLEEFSVEIHSHTVAIGGQWAKASFPIDWERVEASPVRCADPQAEQKMIAAIEGAKAAGDTLGGIFEVVASGVPIGLGSHVHWDRRLDGRLAQAVMSINAVKAVEIGEGYANADLRGSQVHDVILPQGTGSGRMWEHATNRAGGTEGGISNGEPILVRGAVKPISTLGNPLPSVDLATGEKVQAHYERSDICVVPSAGVIGEAMVAVVLADAFLEKFGGDHLEETRRNYEGYIKTITARGVRNK